MSLDLQQFLKAVEDDRVELSRKNSPHGVAACETCSIPLQETVTGSRPCKDKTLCSDCYFEAIGEELDQHPISALRIPRGA